MKKFNLISMFFVFGLMGFKTENKSSWSQWNTTSCYSGLDYSVIRKQYNSYSQKYEWWVKFRNRYNSDVSFNFTVTEPSVSIANPDSRITISANSEKEGSWFLIKDANYVNVFVNKLRFGEDSYKTPYAECD